ncbi:PAS domain S-box protein [Flavihumibacter fluvii]|uniref:PAS domain S-box protein n=1 Tax=Flavihumibacter fluvii TaxID=2838157 RepID=UPI001BDEBD23|nr:PAS domain S-box protein [Flavihumibacter fluvii]ULQ53326.1 PAS domain S-box protein [Flavihumibacter fluvii]
MADSIKSISRIKFLPAGNDLQAMVLLDARGNIQAMDPNAQPTFKKLYGTTLLIGKPFPGSAENEAAHPFGDAVRLAMKGKTTTSEIECIAVNGKVYYYNINCSPALDRNDNVLAISLALRNITEEKMSGMALDNAQQLIDSIFHTSDIGIAIVDYNNRFVKTNTGYNKLFGYENGELEGKKYTITIPPGNRKESLQKLQEFFSGNCIDEERIAIKKNGEQINVFRTATLLNNADQTKYLVITARDISETRKFQQLLQNTEKASHLAGWEMDVATRKISCTAEMYNILEIAEEEFQKLSYPELLERFLDKKTRSVVQQALDDTIKKGKPFTIEIPLITSRQKNKWLTITCTPIRLKSQTTWLRGTAQDTTARKESALQLERLSLVASKTNNAVFIADKNGKTIWVNESVKKLTGYSKEELLGKSAIQMLQEIEADKTTVKEISKILMKRLPVSSAIKMNKKDGTPIWLNIDITPVYKDSNVLNFIAIGVDITDIIKAREEQKIKSTLQQQQRLFNAIANNFPDGIIGLLDKNLHYVFAGGAEIKRLGIPPEGLVGMNIFDHLSDKSNHDARPFLLRALKGDSVLFDIDMKEQTYSVNAVPVHVGGKEDLLVLVVLQNITLRKKTEKDLLETLQKEKDLGEMKTRFVSMASHEFRTPLSTVLSSAYLIEKYTTTEDQPNRQKHLQRIVSSVDMLTEILQDFLSLGQIEEGKIHVRPVEFNISDLVNKLTREIKNNLKKGQQIIYDHKGNLLVTLDPSLLKHIIMNLISNASKFSPENSSIEIRTTQKNQQIMLAVRDFGMGISEEDQKHLMERFFRGANAGNIQGTGLGLHIVSKYAELMNGTVECTSELDKGTEFIISFKPQ